MDKLTPFLGRDPDTICSDSALLLMRVWESARRQDISPRSRGSHLFRAWDTVLPPASELGTCCSLACIPLVRPLLYSAHPALSPAALT